MKTNYSNKRIDELEKIVLTLGVELRINKHLPKKKFSLFNKILTLLRNQNNFTFVKPYKREANNVNQ